MLTKLDGDARGGAALSIAQLTGRPIMFASAGEKLEDFDLFHPDRMASRILDMGDMLTLIEQAEQAFDQEQAAQMAGKLVSGDGFTLEDFVEQLMMVRKLGPIGNLLGMLPGAAQNREILSQIDDHQLDRVLAIVRSMTVEERRNPKIINGSRRARIARGSGVSVGEVGDLVVRFFEAQKMMRQVLGGGMPCRGCPVCDARPSRLRRGRRARRSRKAVGPVARPTVPRPGEAQVRWRRAPVPLAPVRLVPVRQVPVRLAQMREERPAPAGMGDAAATVPARGRTGSVAGLAACPAFAATRPPTSTWRICGTSLPRSSRAAWPKARTQSASSCHLAQKQMRSPRRVGR